MRLRLQGGIQLVRSRFAVARNSNQRRRDAGRRAAHVLGQFRVRLLWLYGECTCQHHRHSQCQWQQWLVAWACARARVLCHRCTAPTLYVQRTHGVRH